ncbi:MAG: tetratricopeptide repeat protein [Thermodesulfobacteriota bacterium]
MKSIVLTTLLLFIVFLPCADITYGKSIEEEAYGKGVEFAMEGRFPEAREAFTSTLRSAPSYAPVRVNLKLIEDLLGGRVEKEVALHLFTALYHFHNDRYDEGSAEFSTALELDEGYATHYYRWYAIAYNNLGVSYKRKGQTNRALSHYNRAVEIDPGYAKAFYNRGLAYIERRQSGLAIVDFSKAIEIDPGYAKAFYNRGLAYAGRGRNDLAMADYNEALDMAPAYGKAYNSRGILLITRLENQDEGCSDLKRACELGVCGAYNFSMKRNICGE